jgi:hypothetical protein
MLMQRASFLGTIEVVEEVNGASVCVAYAGVAHQHAVGNIVQAVPLHRVNDVPLRRLGLSYHCYQVTHWLMDNGTVGHCGLGLWSPGSRCAIEDGLGKGSFLFTARAMLSVVQKA